MTRLRLPLVLAAIATALAACAGGATKPTTLAGCDIGAPGSGVIVTARGTQLALRGAGPTEARLQQVSYDSRPGSVVLSCRPSEGVLRKCVVMYEEPGSQGLGKLALAWADRVIWPADAEQGATAEVRFRFDAATASAARICR